MNNSPRPNLSFAGGTLFTAILLVAASAALFFAVQKASEDRTVSSIRPSTQLAQAVSAPTSGLVDYWNFDEGSGSTAADSVGGNNGTLVNGPTWTTGKIGGALSFNGSDYVQTPSITPASSYSVSFWIKTNGPVSNQATPIEWGIFKAFAFYGGTHKISFIADSSYYNGAISSVSVDDGSWHNIVGVASGSSLQIFVDGAQTGSATDAINLYAAPMLIGSDGGALYGSFNGSIDDVRLYNVALLASDVQSIYAAGSSGVGTIPSAPTTNPPVISNISASSITSSSATITWTTDQPATSQVYYGLTGNGVASSYGSNTAVNSSMTMSPHTTVLSGLNNPNTVYHYQVVSANSSGQSTPSADQTFTTSAAAVTTYAITPSAGANGAISPSSAVAVTPGNNQTFTVTPNNGYQVSQVFVDGASQGAITSYTFTNVAAAHTISATFSAVTTSVGGTYYVNTSTGNDGNAGTQAAPWKTLTASVPKLQPGNTLIVTGTVKEPLPCGGCGIQFNVSGTAANPITIKGQNAVIDIQSGSQNYGNYVFNGDYVVIDGFDVTSSQSGGVYMAGALSFNGNHLTLKNSTFHDISASLVDGADKLYVVLNGGNYNTFSNLTFNNITDGDLYHIWGHDNLITHNTITNNMNPDYNCMLVSGVRTCGTASNPISSLHADLIQFWGCTPSYNNVFEDSLVKNNSMSGGMLSSVADTNGGGACPNMNDWTYRNNIFINSGKIQIRADHFHLYDNVFYNENGAIDIFASVYGNQVIYNNAFIQNTSILNSYGIPGSLTISNNAWDASSKSLEPTVNYAFFDGNQSGKTYGTTFLTASASDFVNAAGGDFHLTANSTLRGKGVNLSTDAYGSMADMDGNARPASGAWDIGPYQFSGTVTTGGPYTITALAGTGGTITPTSALVTSGNNQTFTITPSSGYGISSVSVDGVSQGAIASYTFSGVTATHSISASFSAVTAQTGSILVKLVGSASMNVDTAPSGVWSKIDSGSQTTTNPLTTVFISTGSHTISVPDIAGYTKFYDTCTFTGTAECSMPTASAYSPMTCSGGTCTASVVVTANMTTKVAVLYTAAVTVITVPTDSDNDGVPDSSDSCPGTPAGNQVNSVGCPLPLSSNFTVSVNGSPISNSTNLLSVPSFSIGNAYGTITYQSTNGPYVLLHGNASAYTPTDINDNVTIGQGTVTVNSTAVTELNKPATITLYNIVLTNPSILQGPSICSTCVITTWPTASNGYALSFTVPHFTTFTVSGTSITASNPTLSATLTGSGSGTVTSSDNSINCGSTCSTSTTTGAVFNLTATPASGSSFSGWSGSCTGTNSACSVTISADSSVTANFTLNPVVSNPPSGGGGGGGGGGGSYSTYILTVSKQGTGLGTATSSQYGITCGTLGYVCTATFSAGSNVILNALPQAGSHIASWTGCTSIATSSCTVSLNGPKTITVNFALGSATTSVVNIAAPITTITQPVNCPAGFTCTPSTATGVSTVIPANLLTLSQGTSNSNVVALQNLLIQYGYLRAGLNTGYYGTLTQAAVNAYRAATTVSAVQSAPMSVPTFSGAFTRTLKIGSSGADVKALQVFLNTHGFTIATSGNGSLGNETTYYGPATAAAVSRFQMAHAADILAPYGLTQGTGNFGVGTMRVVNGLK